jgi:molecular chaperone Hsp33
MTGLPDDLIQSFQIDGPGLRGRLIRMGPAADEVLRRHDYPEPVAQLLGEALALAAALAGALKYEGVFTVQTKGDGPVRLMVADITSSGQLRGYAQFDPERLEAALAGPVEGAVPKLLGAGYLAFTVDQGNDTERYQGIVELTGATLADCAHHYFRQSEQIEAGIRLACGLVTHGDHTHWRAGAMMIQRVPDEGGIDEDGEEVTPDIAPTAQEEADDAWRRALLLMGTGTTAELIDPNLAPNDLLFRLFHEDGVRVYAPQYLRAECRCSRERVSSVLAVLPQAEIEEMKEDGEVVVTCEFCNRHYRYDDAALAELYAAATTE